MNETLQAILQAAPAVAGPPTTRPKDDLANIMDQFRKLNSPILKGSMNPIVIDNWISDTERLFT